MVESSRSASHGSRRSAGQTAGTDGCSRDDGFYGSVYWIQSVPDRFGVAARLAAIPPRARRAEPRVRSADGSRMDLTIRGAAGPHARCHACSHWRPAGHRGWGVVCRNHDLRADDMVVGSRWYAVTLSACACSEPYRRLVDRGLDLCVSDLANQPTAAGDVAAITALERRSQRTCADRSPKFQGAMGRSDLYGNQSDSAHHGRSRTASFE